jgi:hypothetical protein
VKVRYGLDADRTTGQWLLGAAFGAVQGDTRRT